MVLPASLFLLFLGAGAEGPLLANGAFEEKAAGKDVSGWVLELGAQNGATVPLSTVELDRREKHGGKASLRFAGDRGTRGWQIAKQEIEVRPGGTYELEAWTRTRGVEPNGFGLDNCYVSLLFLDAAGKLAARESAWPPRPDSEWTRQRLVVTAPQSARKGYVYLFLSMLGDLWVDDLELSVQGGKPLEPPEVVFREDFTRLRSLPSSWKEEIGATSGNGSQRSTVEVDLERGAEGSPRSLHLSGEGDTVKWRHVRREFPAEPGERHVFRGLASCADVRVEGSQFSNCHLNLVFVDGRGDAVGPAQFASLEPGTRDWTELAVQAVAPEGTKKVRVGVFLSMSGDAWFDDLELTREKGLPVPYGDWLTLEGDGVTLRCSPQHPHAAEAKAYLAQLEQSRRATCRALEVEFPDTITVFLYRDLDEGRELTGGTLDFADPENRRVHQQWNSYIGHEMVHVIAHNTLQYGKTGILGEGIAVWLNGQAKNHHRAARELLDEGKLPAVKDLVERFREAENSYPASGSFVGYLLETQGLEVFKEIYPLEDPSAKLEELAGVSFEDLEDEWHEHLRKF